MPKIEKNNNQFEKAPELQEFAKFCEQVATTIGGDITPERVKRLVLLSNQGKHIFHGIKNLSKVALIREKGIKPLTPEGGFVSYWTTGKRLFGELKKDGGLETFDSSFFHYGHSISENGVDDGHMTIAMTNAESLNQFHEIDVRDDDYFSIKFAVPRENLFLLQVGPRGERKGSGRQCAQIAEQEMFELIESKLLNGYKLGQEETKQLDI